MMKRKILLPLIAIVLLLAGCQVFPYVNEPGETDTQPTDFTPTAAIEAPPTEEVTEPSDITETVEVTELPPTETPEATPTATPSTPSYTLQPGSPLYLTNFVHPAAECAWTGVAGQVFDASGNPVKNLIVISGQGDLSSSNQWAAQTGLATDYGPGGYEIQIMDHVEDSTQAFWVQIVGQAGQPLSEQVYFDTFEDCARNLILVNFVASDAEQKVMPEQTETLPAYP
jgi:hypothetical protein